MAPAIKSEEQQRALAEDVQPYGAVHRLMGIALEQGLGVYVWP
jgi:hypothetical protein